jgi:hypothetical protein
VGLESGEKVGVELDDERTGGAWSKGVAAARRNAAGIVAPKLLAIRTSRTGV